LQRQTIRNVPSMLVEG